MLSTLPRRPSRPKMPGRKALTIGTQEAITGMIGPQNNGANVVQLRFTGANLIPKSPLTLIHRVKYTQQTGYYSTFFWTGNPGGDFVSDGAYYGCHPWPPGGSGGTTHNFEVAAEFGDVTTDDNGNNTLVTKDQWYTQAITAEEVGAPLRMRVKFYWDLTVSTLRVITYDFASAWGTTASPCLAYMSTPWETFGLTETHYGVLRALQQYSAVLSLANIQAAAACNTNAAVSALGLADTWYVNMNPTPDDITDKSSAGHNPAWLNANRPTLYTE